MPEANAFGSYAGRLVNARISPVPGSSTTAAPAFVRFALAVASKASSTAFCKSESIVSLSRLPSVASSSSNVRISRPTLLTTTRLAPSSPFSKAL